MGPHALQPRQHIAVLCQLHLRLGVGGLRTHGKDVENERCAVENLHVKLVLDIAQLLRRELVIKDDHTYLAIVVFLVFDILVYLF